MVSYEQRMVWTVNEVNKLKKLKVYGVTYQEHEGAEYKTIEVVASNVVKAYITGYYEKLGGTPYGAFVEYYRTKEGKIHYFNKNCIGNPY